MPWRDIAHLRAFARIAAALASAALVAGCFQPLYGARTPAGTPSVRAALSAVDVKHIDATPNSTEAYVAVQLQNDLLFAFNGGSNPAPPTHRLIVKISGGRSIIMVDQQSALPNLEQYGLSATYSLVEIATGKIVVTGKATSNLDYDTAGSQRFARISAMKDASTRAAKQISDNITARLASYFIAGT